MRKSNKSSDASTARHGSNSQAPIDHQKNEEWKWETSFEKRLGNLLESGFESDLTLVIGETEFKVHKIFLQSGSRILHTSIKNCTADKLTLDNCDPDIFRMVLNYLYTGKSNITVCTSLRVLKMAVELEISGLRYECVEVLKVNTTKENAIEILNEAILCDQKEFVKTTLDFICLYGHDILGLDSFNQLHLEGLVLVLQQDGLQVEGEIDVFNATYRWGEAQLARKGLTSDIANMRTELARPLKHIRFPLMDHKEFRKIVASKKLLDSDDTNAVLTSYLLQIEKPGSIICEEFCTTARAYRRSCQTGGESAEVRTFPNPNPEKRTTVTVYRAGCSSVDVSRFGNKDIYEDSLVFLPPRDGSITAIGFSEACFDLSRMRSDTTKLINGPKIAVDFVEMLETDGGKTLVAGPSIGGFECIQLKADGAKARSSLGLLFAFLPNPIPFRKNVWTRIVVTFPGNQKYSYCVGFYNDKFLDIADPSIVFKFRRATEEVASTVGIIHNFKVSLTA